MGMASPLTTGFGFPWRRDEPCPCGSDRPFAACCLGTNGRSAMAVGSLLPPGPPTGATQAGCYMAETANCGEGLSREHYISRGLIDAPEVKVRGMPWQREEVEHYAPDNLTARMLCRRHNSALSPLDAHAKRFFLALEAGLQHAQRRSLSRRTAFYITSGEALELWAMKTLAGLYASGIEFRTQDHRFRDFEPPMARIVAELSADRPRSLMTLGLPLAQDAHEERVGRRAVSIGPIIDDEAGQLTGLLVRLHGIALYFHIDLHVTGRDDGIQILRPDMIDLIGPERTSRLYLSWLEAGAQGQIVKIRIGRPKRDSPCRALPV